MQSRLADIHAILDRVLNEPTLTHREHAASFINQVIDGANLLYSIISVLEYDEAYANQFQELDEKMTIYRGWLVKLLRLHQSYNDLSVKLYVCHHNLAAPSDYEKTLLSFFHAEGITLRIAQGLCFILFAIRHRVIQTLLAKAAANPTPNPTLSTFLKTAIRDILLAHEREVNVTSSATSSSAIRQFIPLSRNTTILPQDINNIIAMAKLAYAKADTTEKLNLLFFFSYYEEISKPLLFLRLKEMHDQRAPISDAEIRSVITNANYAESMRYYAERLNYYLQAVNQTFSQVLYNLANITTMQVDITNVPDNYPVYLYAKTIDSSFCHITPTDFYAILSEKISHFAVTRSLQITTNRYHSFLATSAGANMASTPPTAEAQSAILQQDFSPLQRTRSH